MNANAYVVAYILIYADADAFADIRNNLIAMVFILTLRYEPMLGSKCVDWSRN